MRIFLIIWLGQLISLLGSAMTTFAIPIWVFGQTERVQELALLNLAFIGPAIIVSPIAGAIVDRYSRKWMMILTDSVTGVTTATLLLLVFMDRLEIWHLYLTTIINGIFYTFQWPAYSSIISLIVPKAQYGRASGLQSLAQSLAEITSPVLAGALLGVVGLTGVLMIDLATFVIAVASLILLRLPEPPRTAEGAAGKGNLWCESTDGFRYILERPGLLGLQLVFTACNFLSSLAFTSLTPMILFRTQQNVTLLSWVYTIGGLGTFVGGAIMSAWGGPQRRIHGVLLGWSCAGLLGFTLLGLGRTWPVWAAGLFIYLLAVPFLNGSNQAIWLAKVVPDLQGRVFATRRMIAWLAYPAARLLVIPLTDGWLEPAMNTGGYLAGSFGWLVGSGPGTGIALLSIFTGVMITVVSLSAYGVRSIRYVEDALPDHELIAVPLKT
jgi:MFS transporter, DHA3 family, macrolide efflux protein